ncbi:divalent metal cation transporter [Haladaptatus halobius]|uniref:divalent metal cation transporter n=1 Tax=Haladaptatus halobius TaxID=2884875 RepID=UPI001D0ABA0D|nr:divalent metal cation transporter [Haladaptatus halobius]
MNKTSSSTTAAEGGAVRDYLGEMGPSWVAGAIAAGPATMASLVTAGARFNYALLWVVILSAVAGALAQYLAMRLGLLTEHGIVGVVEEYIGKWWAWILVVDVVIAAGVAQLVIMNTVASVSSTITGIDARVWGGIWALLLAVGLAGRGYHFIELAAKILVTAVVLAFVASLSVVPIDPGSAVLGLVPSLPSGSAVVAAGILGGAVHITLITMHSYTMHARGWTDREYSLATFDIVASMVVAFGVYSVAIFLVTASVLTNPNLTTVSAAQALGPLVGSSARWLFLLGLGGAAISTLGGNTIVPPFLVADKLGWGTTVEDSRYRALLAAFALLSAPGAFIGGEVIGQLVLVLALGTVGTPFAIAVVLYLLNSRAVPKSNSTLANCGGLTLLLVSGVLAANFIRERIADGVDTLSGVVLVFAIVIGIATIVLLGKYVREEAVVT